MAKQNKRAYYANMLLRPVKEQKLYSGLIWIFMYHSYVLRMDLRTALENFTSVHILLTKKKCVTTKHMLITYFSCSLFRMKRPKQHEANPLNVARFSVEYFWCTRCLPSLDTTLAPQGLYNYLDRCANQVYKVIMPPFGLYKKMEKTMQA